MVGGTSSGGHGVDKNSQFYRIHATTITAYSQMANLSTLLNIYAIFGYRAL